VVDSHITLTIFTPHQPKVFGEAARASSCLQQCPAAISETAHSLAAMLGGWNPSGMGRQFPSGPREPVFVSRSTPPAVYRQTWFWGNANHWLVTLTAAFS